MHKEILSREQESLLPLIKSFSKNFGLVGGTAIALHLGHRRSIDFDLFTNKKFNNGDVRRKIAALFKIEHVLIDRKDEYTIVVDGVKLTFLLYDFPIGYGVKFDTVIELPDLLTLAAMKAYALGRRAKWKDYVDLYFILQTHHSVSQISACAKKIFGEEFNEKNFRMQLAYFEDIDYSEEVEFLQGFEIGDEKIKKGLKSLSIV